MPRSKHLPSTPLAASRIAFIGGIILLALLELALFAHVNRWVTPGTPLFQITRYVQQGMTPLAWLVYVMICVSALSLIDRESFLKRYRRRFFVCWLWSIPAWCYFDVINFYFIHAWEYVGMSRNFTDRLAGYLIAFGAIAPGMFLSAELLMRLGVRKAHFPAFRLSRAALLVIMLVGAALASLPFLLRDPVTNFALWVGTFLFLDPLNALAGRPSILRDWSAGRWGRTLALGAGGLWCGLLWEFWNFWAGAKWVYHLPFLGRLENIRYFEMPLPGLLGFISFGFQTWVMWQTSLIVLGPCVEGEGKTDADRRLREISCF